MIPITPSQINNHKGQLPLYLRLRPASGIAGWPNFKSIAEYRRQYSTGMRVGHLFFIVFISGISVALYWLSRAGGVSLFVWALLIYSAIQVPFGLWLVGNLKS